MSLFGSSSARITPAAPSSENLVQGDLKQDLAVNDPPTDSISALSWSSAGDYLSAASWDNKARIYQIDGGISKPLSMIEHQGPVLDTCWSSKGDKVVSGSADKTAWLLDMQSGNKQQVAAHDQPIRSTRFIEMNGNDYLVTGSWDSTIKYWDLRQPNPMYTVNVNSKVYTMDTKASKVVVGTHDRWIEIFDLTVSAEKHIKKVQSPLKKQTRVVTFSNDGSSYAIGSIEGRCAIQYIAEADSASNYSFRCHRHNDPAQRNVVNVHSVNCISFHPQHGTFSTAGSDGTFHFWDGNAKYRLKAYPEVGGTISATAFNASGSIFAYAVSYDWSQGFAQNNPNYPCKIMLHPVGAEECKPRTGSKKK